MLLTNIVPYDSLWNGPQPRNASISIHCEALANILIRFQMDIMFANSLSFIHMGTELGGWIFNPTLLNVFHSCLEYLRTNHCSEIC